jgi:hypothetical protein
MIRYRKKFVSYSIQKCKVIQAFHHTSTNIVVASFQLRIQSIPISITLQSQSTPQPKGKVIYRYDR